MANGIPYPLTEITEEDRINMVKTQLEKGNHKSVLTKEALPLVTSLVTKAMRTDVERAF